MAKCKLLAAPNRATEERRYKMVGGMDQTEKTGVIVSGQMNRRWKTTAFLLRLNKMPTFSLYYTNQTLRRAQWKRRVREQVE